MNPKTNVSAGDKAFYEKIKNGEVRANYGSSDKGTGWRPVCRGHYLGSACVLTEREAISKGKIFISELMKRVEAVQRPSIKIFDTCDVCGDCADCRNRGVCRFKFENPPAKKINKRTRKNVEVAK